MYNYIGLNRFCTKHLIVELFELKDIELLVNAFDFTKLLSITLKQNYL